MTTYACAIITTPRYGVDDPPVYHRLNDRLAATPLCTMSLPIDMSTAQDTVPADAHYCRKCSALGARLDNVT